MQQNVRKVINSVLKMLSLESLRGLSVNWNEGGMEFMNNSTINLTRPDGEAIFAMSRRKEKSCNVIL